MGRFFLKKSDGKDLHQQDGSYGSGSKGSAGPRSSHHRSESVSSSAGSDDMQARHRRQFSSVQLGSSGGFSPCEVNLSIN